jgi:hypothetical protein
MGDATTTPSASQKAGDAWSGFQAALTRLIDESVRQSLAKAPASPKAADPADLKKTVADTVSAVLLESNLLDRLIERHLKSRPQPAEPAGGARPDIQKAVQEHLAKHLGSVFQGELRSLVQKEVKAFTGSDGLKEVIDEKFRAITLYLKTDVIPKVVRDTLARVEA